MRGDWGVGVLSDNPPASPNRCEAHSQTRPSSARLAEAHSPGICRADLYHEADVYQCRRDALDQGPPEDQIQLPPA
jgi:hypothetical protein